MNAKALEAVRRGCVELDKYFPEGEDWKAYVDLDLLHMASPTYCVLGQLARHLPGEIEGYSDAADVLAGYPEQNEYPTTEGQDAADRWVIENGFDLPDNTTYTYAELKEAWLRVLREVDGEKPQT